MLNTYRAKRDFSKTSEPGANGDAGTGSLTYVIQEHHATHLHWDLRLECDGVLKSWAVPKGPSINPHDKRFAVMVEDHPLAYGSFEGTIPKGQYGGGEVKIWDRGVYAPDEPAPEWKDRNLAQQRVRDGLRKGKLSFTLEGERLRGSWALVRMAKSEENWLLLKHKDEYASEAEPPARQIEPMLAKEAAEPFDGEAWAFEPKLDGIRIVAYKNGDRVDLISRGGLQVAERFSRITAEIAGLPQPELILDGEILALDSAGKPDFEEVMAQYHRKSGRGDAVYYVFDLLKDDRTELIEKSYEIRRHHLQELSLSTAHVKTVESFPEAGKAVFEHAVQLGFEGVVAKRLEGKYEPGVRSDNWRKVKKFHSEDFFVCGWVEGKGYRSKTFGALMLGSMEDGKLTYRGNVGGGFSEKDLLAVYSELEKRPTTESPFLIPPKTLGKTHWISPSLVVEVRFMALTASKHLRFPTFIRMRNHVEKQLSKPRSDVNAEQVAEALLAAPENVTLSIEGMELKLTHLSKELWPKSEFGEAVTKRDLLIHYATVGPYLLPHLKDRPIAYVRYPNGLNGPNFFQKHLPSGAPEFFRTVDVYSNANGREVPYLLIDNLAGLLWLAQMGALEIHPWQSRITEDKSGGQDFATKAGLEESVLELPDFLVLDLDPYTYSGKEAQGGEPELNRGGWNQAVQVALRLHDSLEAIGAANFLKTSGKTGLHVFVPIKRLASYDEVRAVAKTLGQHLARQYPELITMEWSVKKRPAKVFFDFGQNSMGKTLAAIYSTRPTPGALVSFPLTWEQLESAYPTDFTIRTVPKLLASQGDLWEKILESPKPLVGLG